MTPAQRSATPPPAIMDRTRIDADLVARLVGAQFPRWADLPVRPVEEQGWDNCTFRLGDTLSVRLPTAESYVASVEKEQTWLPRLAPHLPLPVPQPVALGHPAPEYPWPWSVRRWLPGRPCGTGTPDDPVAFARDLADFLTALQRINARGGPLPGPHSFHRGAPPAYYDDEVRRSVAALGASIDARSALAVWDDAVAAPLHGEAVWFHGDVAAGNLLVDRSGRLTAVIDFGQCGVGDPACDLVAAWTLLTSDARAAFRRGVTADPAMWARARGWALWKALITLASPSTPAGAATEARRVVGTVLAEHAVR